VDNILYYGDNLDILRRYIKDESIDLIYLDPPFNSNATYNVLFKEQSGAQAAAQLQAFKDTWSWVEAASTYQELILKQGKLGDAIRALGQLLPHGGLLAYLVMMAPRLAELHRVLKPTGSLYLHCDPTASHYLKVVMDAIFGPANFVNEIVWKRSDAKGDAGQGAKHFGRVNDTLLFYAKEAGMHAFFAQFSPLLDDYVERWYRHVDADGRRYKLDNMLGPGGAAKGNPYYEVMGVSRYWRYSRERMQKLIDEGRVVQTRPGAVPMYKRYLDESKGVPLTSNWGDIRPIHGWASEKLGYPTQKPEALLERIIQASSNEGDIVLDPFCGCGTAVVVAQKLHRRWIGIDITQAAIRTIKERLATAFKDTSLQYEVIGEPTTVPDAQRLAADDPYQFQWWSLGLVDARPSEQKKGSDRGIDGRLYFDDTGSGQVKQIILSVKAGNTGVAHIHELRGVVEREKAEIGVLITMQDPTKPMLIDAAEAGFYESRWGKHPKIQILTIADLLAGKKIDMPPAQGVNVTFEKAPRARPSRGKQLRLEGEAP
jgi:DNA modification methylase